LFVSGQCKDGYVAPNTKGAQQGGPCGDCEYNAGAHLATAKKAGGKDYGEIGPLHRFLVTLRNLRLSLMYRHTLAEVDTLQLAQCGDDAVHEKLKIATAALSAVSASDPATTIDAIIALDSLYYRVYYASISGGLKAPARLVPTPATWFTVWVWDPLVICPCVTRGEHDAYKIPCYDARDDLNTDDLNPFLRLWRCNMYTSRWLFGKHSDTNCFQTDVDRSALVCTAPASCAPSGPSGTPQKGDTITMKGPNPCCPDLHRRWRDSCRDFACHVYAYAVPNQAALVELEKHVPLVELGAGTGYWAGVLRTLGVDLIAMDKHPLVTAGHLKSHGKGNEYHGKTVPFSNVRLGVAATLAERQYAGRTLFLCYPPPVSDACSTEALKHYQGDKVLYVGEWDGDTATKKFQQTLVKDFDLVTRLGASEMANWPGTCYTLTVWKKKGSGEVLEGATETDASPPPAADTDASKPPATDIILQCHATSCVRRSRVRCRFSWDVCFCSQKCQEATWPEHQRYLQTRCHLWFEAPLEYHNKEHFRAIKV